MSAIHARMRIGCSPLRHDLYSQLKVIGDPTCACGRGVENAIHCLYDCSLYNDERTSMMDELYKIGKFNIGTLLYGDTTLPPETNARIFEQVQKFMKNTKRFD